MTRQQIETIQKSLEDELASPVNADDPNAVKNKLERLTTFLGTGAQCKTQSHDIFKRTKGQWLRLHFDKVSEMKPSVSKQFIDTGVVDEETLYLRCKDNYDATSKAVEALRSILSLIKTEINAMQ